MVLNNVTDFHQLLETCDMIQMYPEVESYVKEMIASEESAAVKPDLSPLSIITNTINHILSIAKMATQSEVSEFIH